MEIKILKTVWVAEDHDVGEIICVTQKFEDMIDILIYGGYIREDSEIRTDNGWKLIKEVFGDRWKEVFKSFSAKKIDLIMEWDISLRQADLVEVIR